MHMCCKYTDGCRLGKICRKNSRIDHENPQLCMQALAQLFVLDLELKATLQRTPASSKEQFALTSMPQAMPAATKASGKGAVNTTAAAMALGSKSAAAAASPHELMQEAQAAVHGTVFAENADRLHLLLGRLALALAGEQLQELEAGTGGVLVDDVVLLSKVRACISRSLPMVIKKVVIQQGPVLCRLKPLRWL